MLTTNPTDRSLYLKAMRRLVLEFCVFLLIAVFVRSWIMPSFTNIRSSTNAQTFSGGTLPLHVKSEGKVNILARMTMRVSPLHPSLYRIIPDDCIIYLKIDNHVLDPKLFKTCDWDKGKVVDLGKYLTTGTYELEARFTNGGGTGSLSIAPATQDPLMVGLTSAFFIIVLLYGIAGFRLLRLHGRSVTTFTLFSCGALLRLAYVLFTNYRTRAYDWDGHLDYIWYIAQHWTIPLSSAGWEFHQEPLYYFLMAPVVAIGRYFGNVDGYLIRDLQCTSLFLSIAALGIALWIGRIVWQEGADEGGYILFGLLMATFPGFVFLASRISNDTLFLLLSLLFMAILLRFLHSPSRKKWIGIIVVFSLAFLTKSTALVLIPVVGLTLLLCREWSVRTKVSHGLLACGLAVLLIGWLPAYRFASEHKASAMFAFNNPSMHSGLRVETTPAHFLIFHPLRMLRVPFNDPWHDENRRQYFWEYLFRSAFFGEFKLDASLQALAVLILIVGMMATLLALLGAAAETRLRWRAAFPWLALSFCFFIAVLLYRLRNNYSSDQDFRFIEPVIVPLAIFAVQGAYFLKGHLGLLAKESLLALCVFSGIFILALGTL